MKHIYFTVTNDLTYDQRMHRICTSLVHAGFRVTLVGRKLPSSQPLQKQPFAQKRLSCIFNKGFLFYAEYNLRLFFFLLHKNMDGICAIDLDTILAGYFISSAKKITRIYDAHEYFTELKEVRTRAIVCKFWTAIERFAVPQFTYGYTVSGGLADAFAQKYGRNYKVIRNLPVLRPLQADVKKEPILLYQGAVNEARGFEFLIPAMRKIPYKLVICGDGNFMESLKQLIADNCVEGKVDLKGMLLPAELRLWAAKSAIGIALAEREGINQFHALPNKFLEYMHAGLPQVAMNFPEYQKINREYKVAFLLDELSVDGVAAAINNLMGNEALLRKMSEQAIKARETYCWQKEEVGLIQFYQQLFGT